VVKYIREEGSSVGLRGRGEGEEGNVVRWR